jgi:hypothetical protein
MLICIGIFVFNYANIWQLGRFILRVNFKTLFYAKQNQLNLLRRDLGILK